MRSEASLSRLAEMGIDVYVLRKAHGKSPGARLSSVRLPIRRSIALVATATSPGELRLLADIGRALSFARLDVEPVDAAATGSSGAAGSLAPAACIVFATADSKEGGATSVGRAGNHGTSRVPPLARLRADAVAKRTLWRALRDRIRTLHGAADGAPEVNNATSR